MRIFRQSVPYLLFAAVLVGVHLGLRVLGMEFCLTQMTMSLYYAIVVISLCIVMGYAGQVSLGHGAFFAIGGYTSALLTTHDFAPRASVFWNEWLQRAQLLVPRTDLFGSTILCVSPWGAFAVAMMATALIAFLIGWPALRLRGHYLAMATLGFGLIVSKILLGTELFGAADGINGVPEWNLGFGLTVSGRRALRVENYYIASALVLMLLVFLRNLVGARVGRALLAIHDRETAANAMGIDTASYKLRAFVLSALLASLAGVFFTHLTGGIGPSEAGAFKSVRYVALAASGGMSSLWGVTGMSTVMNYLSLRGLFGTYDNAVFGGLLIVIISIAPEGPLKPLGVWLRKLLVRRAASAERGTDHGAA